MLATTPYRTDALGSFDKYNYVLITTVTPVQQVLISRFDVGAEAFSTLAVLG